MQSQMSNNSPDESPNPLSYATHVSQSSDTSPVQLDLGSNKEDILTQSQMLKTTDRNKFIDCQQSEIAGLKKFDVMDIHPISDLPPRARLISSIWSTGVNICLMVEYV
jgi:hypothetical protein